MHSGPGRIITPTKCQLQPSKKRANLFWGFHKSTTLRNPNVRTQKPFPLMFLCVLLQVQRAGAAESSERQRKAGAAGVRCPIGYVSLLQQLPLMIQPV